MSSKVGYDSLYNDEQFSTYIKGFQENRGSGGGDLAP
jgi:hypothetical protein